MRKKQDLVIITPTYNRANCLPQLYNSLKKQTSQDFLWYICDDGSPDDTKAVVESFIEENAIHLRYEKNTNKGKSKTLNEAFSQVQDYLFALIVDDDEILFPDAVSIVLDYISKYKNSDCGMINFNRESIEGKPLSNFNHKEDIYMSIQNMKKLGYYSDGYIGYFLSKLNFVRFPDFKNEKYVAPSVLTLLVSQSYQLLWSNRSLGKTEYRDDGITNSGRKMRLKNPCGMIYHAMLMQKPDTGLKYRLIYSACGYAYLYYSKYELSDIRDKYTQNCAFISVCKPIGYLLSLLWKIKY